MKVTAFSESQSEFLQQVAAARPQLWEYQNRISILDAHSNGDISTTLESLTHSRDHLKRGLLELPPQRNLSQYYTPDPPSILSYRLGDDGNSILEHIPFAGSDPLAWLTAAYENANELLSIAQTLIDECRRSVDVPQNTELFELDPPQIISDPRVPVIELCIHHFNAMTASEVLHVFDARKGTLDMKYDVRWRNAVVLEGIRNGLNIQPRSLQHVSIRHSDGSIETWLTDGSPAQNRIGNHANGARSKDFSEFTRLDAEINDIVSKLRHTVSI